jgi:hypothetical protein
MISVLLVTLPVSIQLFNPELYVRRGYFDILAALMLMPETTMNENYDFVFRYNNIGASL